jgi:hypothetical protein
MIRTTETQNYLGQAACETQITVAKPFNFVLTKGFDSTNTCFVNVETFETCGANPMSNKAISQWDGNTIKTPVHISGQGFMYRCFKGYMVATTKVGMQGFTAPMQVSDNKYIVYQCFDKLGNMLDKANKIEITTKDGEMCIGDRAEQFLGTFIHNGEITRVYGEKFTGLRGLMKLLFNISGALTQYCKKTIVETKSLYDNSEWLSNGYIMKPWGQLFTTDLSFEEAQFAVYRKMGYERTILTNCVLVERGGYSDILLRSGDFLISYQKDNGYRSCELYSWNLEIPLQPDGRFYFPELMKENGTYYGTLTETNELWHDYNFKSGKLTTIEVWLKD